MERFIIAKMTCGEIDEELEITKEEYGKYCRETRKTRAEKVQNSIKQLASIIGIAETKSMVMETLRGL